ncbi:MAG: hypothetical protein WCG01_01120 [bacterium]
MKLLVTVFFCLTMVNPTLILSQDQLLSKSEYNCSEVLGLNYIDGEKQLGAEFPKSDGANHRLEFRICGISDSAFKGFGGDGKYVNAMIVNPRGHKLSVGYLKSLIDKYSRSDTLVTHVIVDPPPSLAKELESK